MSEIVELMRHLRTAKRKSDDADRKASVLRKDYEDRRAAVLGYLNQHEMSSVKSANVTAAAYSADVVEIEDWDAFYRWISRNKAYDALQRRAAVKALIDRREARRDKRIPGVKFERVKRLKVTISKEEK